MQPNQDHVQYRPVTCDFTDDLESFAVKKQSILLKILQEDGETHWAHGIIRDIFTRDHEEFLTLSSGKEVRLDRILDCRDNE